MSRLVNCPFITRFSCYLPNYIVTKNIGMSFIGRYKNNIGSSGAEKPSINIRSSTQHITTINQHFIILQNLQSTYKNMEKTE